MKETQAAKAASKGLTVTNGSASLSGIQQIILLVMLGWALVQWGRLSYGKGPRGWFSTNCDESGY